MLKMKDISVHLHCRFSAGFIMATLGLEGASFYIMSLSRGGNLSCVEPYQLDTSHSDTSLSLRIRLIS